MVKRLGYLHDLKQPINDILLQLGHEPVDRIFEKADFLPAGLLHDMQQKEIYEVDYTEGQTIPALPAYLNILKEADFIRSGSIKNIMALSVSDQSSLYLSLQTRIILLILGEYPIYQSISSSILVEPFTNLPIRIYTNDGCYKRLVKNEGTIATLKTDFELSGNAWIHGIQLEDEVELFWLYRNCRFQDSFLHLIFKEMLK